MQVRLRHATTMVLALVTAASQALAQNPASGDSSTTPACNANVVPTQALAKATFSLQRAFQKVQTKQPAVADLKDGIKFLTTPAPKKEMGDSLGRAYYLGQAYILLLQEPGIKPIGRRGDYGVATDTVLSIDLLAAADSAFTKVEKDWPQCAPELAKWRQQKPWIDVLNGAITELNANHFDSAEVLAKRALIIDRTAPYAYSVLASVANARKQYDTATVYLKKTLELAQKDTIYNDARLNALFDLPNTATMRAEAAPESEKPALVKEAVAAWQKFMPLSTHDVQVASAENSIVRLLKSVNDTNAIPQAYAPIIADPSKYGEQALLNAGLIATRAKRSDDATTLFAAAVAENPYQRDALNNLAASYVNIKEHQKMIPLIDTLVSIDPNNSNNWLLYAYAYTGLLKGTKDHKLVKAYTDSLVKYNTKAEKLPTRVSLSEFSYLPNKATLAGTIENRSPTPKTYTLDVDFLDKNGDTVSSQTTTVGPVPGKGGEAPFSVSVDAQNIVAFRYKPLP